MIDVHVKTREGEQLTLRGESGLSLMQVIRAEGVEDPFALCGGCCSCATCHVYVDDAFAASLPAISEDEDALLDSSSHRTVRSRLSCQLPCVEQLEGIRLQIAPAD